MPATDVRHIDDDAGTMRRSYVRVILAWLLVLAGLAALQEYFS